MHACSFAQSSPTLCDPMDPRGPPGSSVHGIFQAKFWSGLPCPPPGDLPHPGIVPATPGSPSLQEDSLLLSHCRSPNDLVVHVKNKALSGSLTEHEIQNSCSFLVLCRQTWRTLLCMADPGQSWPSGPQPPWPYSTFHLAWNSFLKRGSR